MGWGWVEAKRGRSQRAEASGRQVLRKTRLGLGDGSLSRAGSERYSLSETREYRRTGVSPQESSQNWVGLGGTCGFRTIHWTSEWEGAGSPSVRRGQSQCLWKGAVGSGRGRICG